jgi:hypothetical protein
MPENGIGWEKTRQAFNDAVITRPFRVRMRLARQLFSVAIGTMNGEGSAEHRRNSVRGKL